MQGTSYGDTNLLTGRVLIIGVQNSYILPQPFCAFFKSLKNIINNFNIIKKLNL